MGMSGDYEEAVLLFDVQLMYDSLRKEQQ